jgi:hypothetical protein
VFAFFLYLKNRIAVKVSAHEKGVTNLRRHLGQKLKQA